MTIHFHPNNESEASRAFSRQAPSFDHLYARDPIVIYKRQRVRSHLMRYLSPGSHILELNAGTGEDAVFLARQGHSVHATDISAQMQKILASKVKNHHLEDLVTYERCSFTQLSQLKNKGPYDLIFSNFAGLNCTNNLPEVLDSLGSLLKPGGIITLVLLPGFCLWESLLVFKGKFRTAFRRLAGPKGATAHIEGVLFRCWYYRPRPIIRQLARSYYLLNTEGLCSFVPPSYMVGFTTRWPRLYRWLVGLESRFKGKWPWKFIGDYMILTFVAKR
jgi:ubiquinone/menaquinone biosynthesis C-methylase UbiE